MLLTVTYHVRYKYAKANHTFVMEKIRYHKNQGYCQADQVCTKLGELAQATT